MRGTSAAVRMQPHDLAYLLAGLLDRADAPAADHTHHAAGGWTPPPMHPEVSMPPALMTLRPDVAPYALAKDDAIPMARPRELFTLRDGVRSAHGSAGAADPVRANRHDAGLQRSVSGPVDPGR